jgi:hypothetical protein
MRVDNHTDGGNLIIRHRARYPGAGDNVFDPDGGEHRKTMIYVETAKQITRKKSRIDFLDATGVVAAFQVSWKECFIALPLESSTHKLFGSAADTKSEPW